MADALALMPGTLIGGHYIIDTLINTGGFGSVYRGIDRSEGDRPCAIKETYDVTPAARRQALTEAAVLFTIRSKHLPQVYDAFEDNGRFYLVMQLIEGQTLLQINRQRGGPCSEQEVLRWLLPIIEVLQELHSRNPAVIHRDIKPGNIILTPDGTAVLVDFGITKLYDPSSNTQTLVRAVSEGFSPIEQYLSKTGPQSDIYAMAATMYFLLTCVVPPQSINRSYADTLIAPTRLNPRITPATGRALLQALAVQPEARFSSMHDFARALTQPSFASYSDSTLATSHGGSHTASYGQAASAVTERAQSFVASRPVSTPPAQPSIQQQSLARPPLAPVGRVTQEPLYPVLPSRPPAARRAPAPAPVYRALPSPFHQGCLWGLLQGVLAAAMILALKNQVYVFVGILEGILFYIAAGFFTTRKGGGSFRGAWAGFWSGISSTLVFWLVTFLGVLVLVAQRLQIDENAARAQGRQINLAIALNRAFRLVAPSFATQPSTQQNNNGLVIYLAVGLLVAILAGWLGGLLGNARFRARF